ncbi:MAG TPA: hypothetical protein VHB77_22315 [Planctomycetaceae bacterium]|nr:hypothetical protein [Planctomycetaceae bacterium]
MSVPEMLTVVMPLTPKPPAVPYETPAGPPAQKQSETYEFVYVRL